MFIQEIIFVINLDEYKSIETHWIALYANGNDGKAFYNAIYFNSFGVEKIPMEINKFTGHKKAISSIYRIQA